MGRMGKCRDGDQDDGFGSHACLWERQCNFDVILRVSVSRSDAIEVSGDWIAEDEVQDRSETRRV
jgi:hypothetical protein